MTRDLSLVCADAIPAAALEETIRAAGGQYLEAVTLFDVYRGEKILLGKKQYALNFVLQDLEHTLTDAEGENTMNRVLEALKNELGAILR